MKNKERLLVGDHELESLIKLMDLKSLYKRTKSQRKIMKLCKCCSEEKSITSFTNNNDCKDNFNNIIIYEECNLCYKRNIKIIQKNHKEQEMKKMILECFAEVFEKI